MMLHRCRFFYHLRKPRVLSQNDKSYIQYTKNLREARRNVHIENRDYQNKIEDQYLQKHKEQMKQRHFENQCSFRGQVFTNAYRYQQNQIKWDQQNSIFDSRLNKHLHDEDVRKINRSRILKIMEHQSSQFWFNGQNVNQKLREQTIFPEYIASTEYYYKLFAEALAYELGDFEQLHQVTSNEEIIRQKNKYLIPIYLTLRNKITAYKRDQISQEKYRFGLLVQKLRGSLTGIQLESTIAKQQEKFNIKLKQIQHSIKTPEEKLKIFKDKIKELVSVLKTWKQYTNVLSLTSAQIIKNQYDTKKQSSINRTQNDVLSSLKSRKDEAFVNSIEEDTEDIQISFEQYVRKINQQKKQTKLTSNSSGSADELDYLLNVTMESPPAVQVNIQQIDLASKEPLDLGGFLKSASQPLTSNTQNSAEPQEELVNPEFMNSRQTTSSVQTLKQRFQGDTQFIKVLNQLGEIDVRYPKLFQTIWSSIQG